MEIHRKTRYIFYLRHYFRFRASLTTSVFRASLATSVSVPPIPLTRMSPMACLLWCKGTSAVWSAVTNGLRNGIPVLNRPPLRGRSVRERGGVRVELFVLSSPAQQLGDISQTWLCGGRPYPQTDMHQLVCP